MKKYLSSQLIIKIGFLLSSGLSSQVLSGDISEALHRNNLLEDWNRDQTRTPSANLPKNSAQLGLNDVFFPIEADLPAPGTPKSNKQEERRQSDGSQHQETVREAIQEFNHALKEVAAQTEDSPEAAYMTFTQKPAEQPQESKPALTEPRQAPKQAIPPEPAEKKIAQQSPLPTHQRPLVLIADASHPSGNTIEAKPNAGPNNSDEKSQPILIRFNNVSIIEYLRFLSGISHKNFIFDENDLQFNITMISEEPTSIDDFMTALLQELRIHDLTLLEQGNNLVIHKNPKVNSVSTVITEDIGDKKTHSELVTQVFRLNTADAEKVAAIVRPLISETALVEVIKDTNHLILTDLVANVTEIAKLIRSIDSPKGGLVIGQYVIRSSTIDNVLPIVQQLMGPISLDQPIQYVPYTPSNSVFIVSTPFLVERALSILQHLDQNDKSTKIFDLKDLKYNSEAGGAVGGKGGTGGAALPPAGLFVNSETFVPVPGGEAEGPYAPGGTGVGGQRGGAGGSGAGWKIDNGGNWTFKVMTNPGEEINPNLPPQGKWVLDPKGTWLFVPGVQPTTQDESQGPRGHWDLDRAGNWEFLLDKGESTFVNVLSRAAPDKEELLPGSKPKGQFFLHKVHYRKGDELERSFQAMSDALRDTENVDVDLVNALLSVQYLESSNSLVFSGTPDSLKKIALLVDEIDVPLRQVFIEMLILEASLVDALNYSVKWGNKFAGGNWAGADGFDSTYPSPMSAALNSAGVTNLGQPVQINTTTGLPILAQVLTPNPTPFLGTPGFDIGIIGQRIFNKLTGIEFESIGAFINALRAIATSNIILNPKIITEDGVPAEIFVGENIAYQTQSIVNDQGVILTSNFEYRDVGTRLKVTPYLGGSDVIALEIENEITNVISSAQAGLPANSNVGPNTSKSSTTTRVHIPSGFFLVISGMLRDETRRTDAHAPCLGGIPILGGAFKDKKYEDQKRNLMIFMQPRIVDTDEEMQCLTKHQQDLFKFKNRRKKDMLYETEEFMDFINMKKYEHEKTSIEFEDDEDPL